jgi:uncharacterized protein (DUF488 family)
MTQLIVYTVGHSTHELAEFIYILKSYKITLLADIRTMPGSRRVPQFNKENLEPALQAEGIQYIHIKKLGGLRKTTKDSVNTGWRNKSFRGFADYMQTAEFEEGLQELISLAKKSVTAIMCAEAVPWRCHRSLVGDALLARGFEVKDIFSEKKEADHKLTSFAKVDGQKITYPGKTDE